MELKINSEVAKLTELFAARTDAGSLSNGMSGMLMVMKQLIQEHRNEKEIIFADADGISNNSLKDIVNQTHRSSRFKLAYNANAPLMLTPDQEKDLLHIKRAVQSFIGKALTDSDALLLTALTVEAVHDNRYGEHNDKGATFGYALLTKKNQIEPCVVAF